VSLDNTAISHRFVCPQCGSSEWGSVSVGSLAATIHCHGDGDTGCSFSAPYADLFRFTVFTLKPLNRADCEHLLRMERAAAGLFRPEPPEPK
jgi:hypothetical protein